MRPSTKRVLSIGAAFFLVVGAFIVYQNLIQPEGKIISVKRGLVGSKANLFESQEQAVSQVQGLISQFQNIRNVQEVVALAIPDRPDTTRALSQIEAIARSSGVAILSLDFKDLGGRSSPQSLVKRLGVIEIKIGAVGSYLGLKNFLRSTETNVRVANVKDLNIRAGAGKDVYNLSQTVEVYYQQR
jgi:Tfp pilus assembly protein PilO